MRRFIILTALTAPLVVLPARAQYPPPPPAGATGGGMALVDGWIRQFLGRPANQGDVGSGQALDAGTVQPQVLLSRILACDEYYAHVGGEDRRYIRGLFRDLSGRPPSPREESYWLNRLLHTPEGMEGRTQIAYELLQRYPEALSGRAPQVPEYDYRRPSERDRDRDRDYRDRDRDYRDRDYRDRDRDYRDRDRDRGYRDRDRDRRDRD